MDEWTGSSASAASQPGRIFVGTLQRVVRGIRSLLIACALALVFVTTALGSWAGSDPVKNYPPGKPALGCSSSPRGKACVNGAVYYLDKARASLGQPAYALPADFPSLAPDQQLFILTNLDRIQAGLPPITGLTSALSSDALTSGVQMAADPAPSDATSLSGWTGNWAGGFLYANAPMAYEAWMYDDGLGSDNVDCTTTNQGGCWGHRHNILWQFASSAVLAMGAAAGVGPFKQPGYATLLVGGYPVNNTFGKPAYTPTYTYTWAQAVADGAGTNAYNPGVPVTKYCLVPNLIGKKLPAAKRALKKAHCTLGNVLQKHTGYPKGTIVFQSPATNKARPTGSKVKVTVSLGP